MKRSTKRNVGTWPNLRADSLTAISNELIRARKKHPRKGEHLAIAHSYFRELRDTLHNYVAGDPGKSATQIYALAATVAAMAIRVMEEGDSRFPEYTGNTQAPEFNLTNPDNDRAH